MQNTNFFANFCHFWGQQLSICYLSRERSFTSRSIFDDGSKRDKTIRLENSNLLVKAIPSSLMRPLYYPPAHEIKHFYLAMF